MLRKIYSFVSKMETKRILKRYKEVIDIDSSTILMTGFSIRFDAKPEQREYIRIGKRCLVNAKLIFESNQGHIEIGDNAYIGGATLISRSSIKIGNDVTTAWGVMIYDHDSHSVYWEHRKNDNNHAYYDLNNGGFNESHDWGHVNTAPIIIDDKVWIGFDAVIFKGVHIGEGAVVAARSVVTKDVPAYTLVAGNPAQLVKKLDV